MISFINKAFKEQFYPVKLVVLLSVAISTFTRMALLLKSGSGFDWNILNLLGVFSIGLFYDLAMLSYFIIPLVLYCWLLPSKWYAKSGHRFVLYGYLLLMVFLGIFNAVSEWFFWDEFSTRYNFIAVDYLVYTTEVVGNIWQSYPIGKLLIAILLISVGVLWKVRSSVKQSMQASFRFGKRTTIAIPLLVLPLLTYFLVSNKGKKFSENEYANELAGNGLFDFGSAFWNNELDYTSFYQILPQNEVVSILRKSLQEKDSKFLNNNVGIEREINHQEPEKKLNVVLISVESLSASFLAHFGNTQGITPQLDSLADQGILFTQLYASGTRTVRGLESLSLAIPPTPGQSIVKRPDNEGLFSLGSVFESKGYRTQFIYGGYSYFDNMGYFFANNGYQAIDRDAINRLLDNQYVAHVGFIDQDNNLPFVIPMGFARDNDRILLHGSTGSRMMRQIAQGIDLCVTVTQLNAIVVARSSFNSSMNYESVMIFGVARVLEESEKDLALERITEKLVPGLWNYGRPLVSKEIAATMIVELPLDKISAKSREGDPSDDEEDLALPIWAGILPIETKLGAPITAANAAGIAVPSHIA